MLDEDLIVTLEQDLRQTRTKKQRLKQKRDELKRLSNDVTSGQERLDREIDALENNAKQTENAIYGLLDALRKNKH